MADDKVSGEKLIRLGHSQARISAMKNPGPFNSRKDQRKIGAAGAKNLMEGARRKTLAKKKAKQVDHSKPTLSTK